MSGKMIYANIYPWVMVERVWLQQSEGESNEESTPVSVSAAVVAQQAAAVVAQQAAAAHAAAAAVSAAVANAAATATPDKTLVPVSQASQPKRLHVSNIPFRFRDPDLRNMFGVRIHTDYSRPWANLARHVYRCCYLDDVDNPNF